MDTDPLYLHVASQTPPSEQGLLRDAFYVFWPIAAVVGDEEPLLISSSLHGENTLGGSVLVITESRVVQAEISGAAPDPKAGVASVTVSTRSLRDLTSVELAGGSDSEWGHSREKLPRSATVSCAMSHGSDFRFPLEQLVAGLDREVRPMVEKAFNHLLTILAHRGRAGV